MEPQKDISNRKILALAAVAALAVLGILLHAQILGGSLPPQISRLSMGSSGTSGYMILLCLVATGWGYSVYIRCSDKTIRNYLIIIATLIVLWMLDVLLKYPMPDPPVSDQVIYVVLLLHANDHHSHALLFQRASLGGA